MDVARAGTLLGDAFTNGRPARARQAGLGAAVVVFCWWVGGAVERGGLVQGFVLSLAVLVLVAVVASLAVRRRHLGGVLAVEAPVTLLLMSTVVLRQRTTDELAYDPLDPAAQFRVACVALALLLAGVALVSRPRRDRVPLAARMPAPFWLYALFVWVVFLGAIFSSRPTLTAYRGIELLVAILVVAGALHQVGRAAVARLMAPLYWFAVALMASVWVGVLVANEAAVARVESPMPWQVLGVYPVISANGVGTVGATVLLWTLARRWSRGASRERRPLDHLLMAVGLVTLLAAQYRTGYVATLVGVALLMGLWRRTLLWITVTVVVLLVGTGTMASLTRSAEPVALRGQSWERATELSGRFNWWNEALPLWHDSPVIGRGLLTATRFEVLAKQGFETTSTIHGTWIEALVGTGVLGVGALGSAFLLTAWLALRHARRHGDAVPLALVAFLAVRSLTGPTIEVFGHEALILLVIALRVGGLDAPAAAVPAPGVLRVDAPRPAGDDPFGRPRRRGAGYPVTNVPVTSKP